VSAPDPHAVPDDRAPSAWRRFTAARMDPRAYMGLHATVGIAVAALALWLFGALLDAVLDNATLVRWDMATDAAIHARATPAGLRAFDAITQLGSPVALGVMGLIGAVVLWRQRRRTLMVGWIAALVGDLALNEALKRAVHRDRPTYGAAYLHGHSFSFPSGHAMGSIVAYGMLAYVLAHRAYPGRVPRWALYATAAAIVLGIGLSRVYLGVHYPSDVVGGWAAGAGWLSFCITGVGIARRRAASRATVDAGEVA
jgi:membrane-associated phospholipid phosphatase